MNGFEINTDQWHIDGFSYGEDGGLEDEEWLCDWDCETQDFEGQIEPDTVFVIKNFEKLQVVFEKYKNDEPQSKKIQDAEYLCYFIIIVRFMELMRKAHLVAKQKQYSWAKIPIYFAKHDQDYTVKSEN
jgi:hypothetical protein